MLPDKMGPFCSSPPVALPLDPFYCESRDPLCFFKLIPYVLYGV